MMELPYQKSSCFKIQQVKYCNDRVSKKKRLPNPKIKTKQFKKWLILGGREDLLKRDWQQVHRSHLLCKKHFSSANFYPNSDKLRETACPDTNLPDISSTVQAEIEEGALIDMPSTSYCRFGESKDWGDTSPGKDNRLPENSDAIQLKAIEYYKKKKKK